MALAAVAKSFFEVVALDVHDDTVGKGEGVFSISGDQRFLVFDAAGDHGSHFRVFRFNRSDAAVEKRNFPEGTGGGALNADDEFVGLPEAKCGATPTPERGASDGEKRATSNERLEPPYLGGENCLSWWRKEVARSAGVVRKFFFCSASATCRHDGAAKPNPV